MRAFAVVAVLLALAPSALAQDATQEELEATGLQIMIATFVLIVAGAVGMWLVNHRYHPPGEAQRARSRKD